MARKNSTGRCTKPKLGMETVLHSKTCEIESLDGKVQVRKEECLDYVQKRLGKIRSVAFMKQPKFQLHYQFCMV